MLALVASICLRLDLSCDLRWVWSSRGLSWSCSWCSIIDTVGMLEFNKLKTPVIGIVWGGRETNPSEVFSLVVGELLSLLMVYGVFYNFLWLSNQILRIAINLCEELQEDENGLPNFSYAALACDTRTWILIDNDFVISLKIISKQNTVLLWNLEVF